jgi:signal transduction histidine kinase
MYESLIPLCRAMDKFGLPLAIGKRAGDQFLFANESFLRVVGLQANEISLVRLSEVVKFDLGLLKVERRQTPVRIRAIEGKVTARGHASFSSDGLVYLMIPPYLESNPDLESGMPDGQEIERQRLSDYIHHRLGPEVMAVTFSIESLRTRLEQEKHPAEAELKQIEDRLSDVFQSFRENFSFDSSVSASLNVVIAGDSRVPE